MLMLWLFCILALAALTFLAYQALKWRFVIRRDKYNLEKNYISKVAILA